MIRRAGQQDVRFLRDMLHHAFYWREGGSTEEEPTYRYVYNWGRPGDAGVIALDEGFPVGAAWYRLFTDDQPGYGFIDESTPELAIAVVPSRRGRGIGAEMLEALLARAREDGHGSLTLAVDRGNPAIRLYERFGFGEARTEGSTVVMQAPVASSESD